MKADFDPSTEFIPVTPRQLDELRARRDSSHPRRIDARDMEAFLGGRAAVVVGSDFVPMELAQIMRVIARRSERNGHRIDARLMQLFLDADLARSAKLDHVPFVHRASAVARRRFALQRLQSA